MSSKIQFQLNMYKYWCWLSVIIIFSATAIKPLKAQVIKTTQIPNHKTAQVPNIRPEPGKPPSDQPLPEQSPLLLPSPEELLQPPDTTTPTPEPIPSGEVPQTIIVKKFKITGSTVFSPEDFDKTTKPFTNRPITFAQLFQLRSEITKLYVDKGYITSGAYIPPQKLQNGVVEIKVVEGELEDIKVIGTQKLHPKYLQSRLAIATKKPLNRDRLLEALQLLQLNPLIETLSAELSAGSRPGQSLLEVKITEANTFNVQLILDNGRSPAVGTFRRQIQVNEANLSGWGDRISAVYANTDGSNALDLNYTLPINPHNGTLSFSYGFSDNQVIERPFDVLDIQSNSNYYELSLRQPIIQKPTQEFILGLTASHRRSKATFLDDEVPFPGTGTDAEGRTQVTAVRFFQEWVSRDSQQVFAMRSQLSVGLDLFDATINETFPDSRFVAWRGQAQWVRLLGRDTLLVLRGDVQLADRPLVPFEQIGIGGLDSVRGYRQDALLTDNGIFASAEVRIPVVRFSGRNNFLQVAPFVDFGNGWNDSGRSDFEVELDSHTLLSVGLGLRLQLEDNLTARLDWGIPLISITSEDKDSWQENGLYFSIIVNPF
ncbi:ShlB/FhaC/HecB family hemolysin secretion/activation protein [Pelatocladus sp. BLCC-F211]|uniref:ShlB/FhaC/HecB family hemolysin secretion/activation protein n=1 Tax=Pelatocladus sp. BLCC-F211 TaxID=3342752 RepID=UPI0035B90666